MWWVGSSNGGYGGYGGYDLCASVFCGYHPLQYDSLELLPVLLVHEYRDFFRSLDGL